MSPTKDRERAAADVLSATRGDPKAPGPGGPAGSPRQAVGTGDQKLEDGLSVVLNRGLCHPRPQGRHLALWGGPEPNHKSPKNNHYFYIFYQKTKLSVTEGDSSRTWCRFPFAFLQQLQPGLLLDDVFCRILLLRVRLELSLFKGKEQCRKLELPVIFTLWSVEWGEAKAGGQCPHSPHSNRVPFCFTGLETSDPAQLIHFKSGETEAEREAGEAGLSTCSPGSVFLLFLA